MDKMILDKNRRMKIVGENVYDIPEDWIDMRIPSSICCTLLNKRLRPKIKVCLNGRLLGQTDNIRRVWELDVEEITKVGENMLRMEILEGEASTFELRPVYQIR